MLDGNTIMDQLAALLASPGMCASGVTTLSYSLRTFRKRANRSEQGGSAPIQNLWISKRYSFPKTKPLQLFLQISALHKSLPSKNHKLISLRCYQVCLVFWQRMIPCNIRPKAPILNNLGSTQKYQCFHFGAPKESFVRTLGPSRKGAGDLVLEDFWTNKPHHDKQVPVAHHFHAFTKL